MKRLIAISVAAFLSTMLNATAQPTMPDPNAPVEAGVITLEKRDIPFSVSVTGVVAAKDSADIRPLVDGVITEILYEPGNEVEAGDPLFRIDSATYEAALLSAEAQLLNAQSAVPAAEAAAQRARSLLGTGATQATLDAAEMTLDQARASVLMAEASLRTAKINMDRTTVTSPISGVAGIPSVSVGDLVGAQSEAITNIVSLDPIYVDVEESSSRILDVRKRFSTGEIKPGDALGVTLTLENGEEHSGTGIMQAMSSRVSSTTGTVKVRLMFDNPESVLLPGMFVTAHITLGSSEGIEVPQLAAPVQADGRVKVMVLGKDEVVEERLLLTSMHTRNSWVITQGLTEGEKLVVDRLNSLRAGAKVAPVEMRVTETGVLMNAKNED